MTRSARAGARRSAERRPSLTGSPGALAVFVVTLLFLQAGGAGAQQQPPQLLLPVAVGRGALTTGGSSTNLALYQASVLPLFTVTGNASLTVRHAWIDASNATWSQAAANGTSALEAVLATLVQRAGDSMYSVAVGDVTLQTSCQRVAQLQNLLCADGNVSTQSAVQVYPGELHVVGALLPGGARVSNLRLTCRNRRELPVLTLGAVLTALRRDSAVAAGGAAPQFPADAGAGRGGAPGMACAVAHVVDWAEMLVASAALQPHANTTVMVLRANLTAHADLGDIPVYRRMVVTSSVLDTAGGTLVWACLGYAHRRATWTLDANATIAFHGIMFVSLPLGPSEKFPWAMFGWALWSVNTDRCRPVGQPAQVQVLNSTIVLPPEVMDYMAHWTGEANSPFPERAAAARWYGVDATCTPPVPQPFLLKNAKVLSQRWWLTPNATAFGVVFLNVTFTDRHPAGVPGTGPTLQLTHMFETPYPPFTAVAWVETADQLVQELARGTSNYIVLLTNISVPASAWPAAAVGGVGGAVTVAQGRSLAISGWPNRRTYLDLQRQAARVKLKSPISLLNLAIMNGAQDVQGPRSTWAANLTLLQWTFNYTRVQQLLQLRNTTLVIPPSELGLLLSSAASSASSSTPGSSSESPAPTTAESGGDGPAYEGAPPGSLAPNSTLELGQDGTITGSGAPGTFWATTALRPDGCLAVGVVVEDGLVGYDVVLESELATQLPFPVINITVSLKAGAQQAVPQPPPAGGAAAGAHEDDASAEVKRTVAIAVPVGVVLMAVAAAATFLLTRRAARRRAAAAAAAAAALHGAPPSKHRGSEDSLPDSVASGAGSAAADGAPGAERPSARGKAAAAAAAGGVEDEEGSRRPASSVGAETLTDSAESCGANGDGGGGGGGGGALCIGPASVDMLDGGEAQEVKASSSCCGLVVAGAAAAGAAAGPPAATAAVLGGAALGRSSARASEGGTAPQAVPLGGAPRQPGSASGSASLRSSRGAGTAASSGDSSGTRLGPPAPMPAAGSARSSAAAATAAAWPAAHSGSGSGGAPASVGACGAHTPPGTMLVPVRSSAPASDPSGALPWLPKPPQPPQASYVFGGGGTAGPWGQAARASPALPLTAAAAASSRSHLTQLATPPAGVKAPAGAGSGTGTGAWQLSGGTSAGSSAGAAPGSRGWGGPSPPPPLPAPSSSSHRRSASSLLADAAAGGAGPASSRSMSSSGGGGVRASGRGSAGGSGSTFSQDDCQLDSFDLVPEHHEQLLINRMELSKELQASIAAPDVASQLKEMVANLQSELGDQEVEITRVIGQGGSGVVYQGLWRGLTVAVKTLVFTVLPMQPMSRKQHRAMTEAALCRTLQHPHIVATYAYDLHTLMAAAAGGSHGGGGRAGGSGQSGGASGGAGGGGVTVAPGAAHAMEFKLFIIQEFCDGGTLKAAIDDGKLHDLSSGAPRPVMSHILQLATDIAAGMSHVHSRRVVHGDLTPANVLLKGAQGTASGWQAKVADFGLSWKLASGQEHVSNARQGTGFYIAPEVLHVGIMSKAADVFSFGMVLHEMYHGQPYWRRFEQGGVGGGSAALHLPGLEQLSWSPSCPEDFRELVCSCLSSDLQARPTFFQIVEQLLAMQRRMYAEEEERAAAAGAGASSGASSAPPGAGGVGVPWRPLAAQQHQAVAGRGVAGGVSFDGSGVGSGAEGGVATAAAAARSFSVDDSGRGPAGGGGWGGERARRGAPRQPTTGMLTERDVKAMWRSMRQAAGGGGGGGGGAGGGTAVQQWAPQELAGAAEAWAKEEEEQQQQQRQERLGKDGVGKSRLGVAGKARGGAALAAVEEDAVPTPATPRP